MSDRVRWYHRQRVNEAELNLAFDQLEQADRNLAADIGVYGIVSGAEPVPHEPVPDLTIDLAAPGRAYDRLGQRIYFGVGQSVSCERDSAGVSTEVMMAGRERWLGVFLRFRRLLSDERTDGNSQRVFFRQDESFEIVVRQGAEGPEGAALRVPMEPDEILVCEVRRLFGVNRILREHLDLSRRQALVFARSDAVGIDAELWRTLRPNAPTVQAALDEVDARYAAHVGGEAERHPAQHVTFTPAGILTGQNVQVALAELVQKLQASATGTAGAALVGADAVPGTPRALAAGTVDSQLAFLLEFLNAHLSATSAAHAASAIRATPHNWLTAESVQAQLQELAAGLRGDRVSVPAFRNLTSTTVQAQLREIIDDLRSTAATDGTALVGGAELPGNPRSVPAGTLLAQLRGIVDQLNAHAGSQDHDSRYVRRILSESVDIPPNSTRSFSINTFPSLVEFAVDEMTDTGPRRWFQGPLTAQIRVWVDKNNDTRVIRLLAQNRNTSEVRLVIGAYVVG
jgi:hypothetical protein